MWYTTNTSDIFISKVFFAVMFGSILAGQAGPSMQGIASARGAAYQVFELIDRVSMKPVDRIWLSPSVVLSCDYTPIVIDPFLFRSPLLTFHLKKEWFLRR